jgi:hypothetical protein
MWNPNRYSSYLEDVSEDEALHEVKRARMDTIAEAVSLAEAESPSSLDFDRFMATFSRKYADLIHSHDFV